MRAHEAGKEKLWAGRGGVRGEEMADGLIQTHYMNDKF